MGSYVMAVRVAESPTGLYFEPEPQIKSPSKSSMWQKLGLGRLFPRDGHVERSDPPVPQWTTDRPQGLRRNWSRRVGVGLPRPATFKRQNSERREHLEPVNPSHGEKRALSHTRQRAFSLQRPRACSSPPPFPLPRTSAPAVTTHSNDFPELSHASTAPCHTEGTENVPELLNGFGNELQKAPSQTFSDEPPPSNYDEDDRDQVNADLESRWILNLSMHFRDKSDREKFFITYAQEPNLWRRVTVSCDYRRAEPDSLEMDLKELQFQRDKSAQIYEAIRDSLPDIQFYDTVTNLKLETTDGRLHVHVTEDVNEIIPYPPISSVSHLTDAKIVRESEIAFDSHLSGFVYRVNYRNDDFIKKEIPGPDTVDEFLYEMNALYSVRGSNSVIDFKGVIVDDQRRVVKGVLIDFAEQGALVDLIYDHKGELDMDRRLRWAQQAVEGLEEIHEGGFVQGDLTLSNIVIDGKDNAKIIDINRRGCPVGWEPPEIADKIASNQRISMYIGVKSDLYQLGMTLWGIAAQEDEPERCDRPLDLEQRLAGFPSWYKDVVKTCLSDRPRDRLSAKELLALFPTKQPTVPEYQYNGKNNAQGRPKRYIEPSAAVEREDLERFGSTGPRQNTCNPVDHDSAGETLIPAPSTTYRDDSSNSVIDISKIGRYIHDASHPLFEERGRRRSRDDEIEALVDDDSEAEAEAHIVSVSPDANQQHTEITLDGIPYIIEKSSFDPKDLEVLESKLNDIERPNQPSALDQSFMSSEAQDQTVRDCSGSAVNQAQISSNITRSAQSGSSETSQSTPRNSLPTYTSIAPSAPSSISMAGDLACCGGNPTLEEQCSHEPKFNTSNSTYVPQAEDPTARFERSLETGAPLPSGGLSEDKPTLSSEQARSLLPQVPWLDSFPSISDINSHSSGTESKSPDPEYQMSTTEFPSQEPQGPQEHPPSNTGRDTVSITNLIEPSAGFEDASSVSISETKPSPANLVPENPQSLSLDCDSVTAAPLPTISIESPDSANMIPNQQTSNSSGDT